VFVNEEEDQDEFTFHIFPYSYGFSESFNHFRNIPSLINFVVDSEIQSTEEPNLRDISWTEVFFLKIEDNSWGFKNILKSPKYASAVATEGKYILLNDSHKLFEYHLQQMDMDMSEICAMLLFTKTRFIRCLEQLEVGNVPEIKKFLLQQAQEQKSGIKGVVAVGKDRFGNFLVHKSIDGKIKVVAGVPPPLPPTSFSSFVPIPQRGDGDKDEDRHMMAMWHHLNAYTLPNDPEGEQQMRIQLVAEEVERRDKIYKKRLKSAIKDWERKNPSSHNLGLKEEDQNRLKDEISGIIIN